MRHNASLLLGSLLLPLLASCASPQAEPPHETITITLADTVVSVDRDSVSLARSQIVRWVSVPADGHWIVGFGAATPFRNRRVFQGGTGIPADFQAPIDSGAALGDYEYWIFFADDDGDYHVLDPKLVIIDDPGAPPDSMPRP